MFFLDSKVLLCDFHREQAWERWLNLVANGMQAVKEEPLFMLRRIADSETEESFQINLNFLFNSNLWNDEQHGKFKNWMNNVWLPCYKVCKISSHEELFRLIRALFCTKIVA